jgi:hypothetical protein
MLARIDSLDKALHCFAYVMGEVAARTVETEVVAVRRNLVAA